MSDPTRDPWLDAGAAFIILCVIFAWIVAFWPT